MVVMIHSCNKRLWYVRDFLIPDLSAQGAETILWNDDEGKGCLKSWVSSCLWICEHFPNGGGIWHLQDDVLIVSDFMDRIKEMPQDIVCNGFVYSDPANERLKTICNKTGIQKVNDYWFSFPCCYVPNKYIYGFVDWFYQDVLRAGKYANKVQAGLYDDFFFWQYMKINHKNDYVLNVVPNLVQHVDYLLGGSVANEKKHMRKPACYWVEPEREKDLERRVAKWREQEGQKLK